METSMETTMETRILEGKPIARAIREDVAGRAAALAGRGAPAKLAIVMVGDDPGSAIYSKSLMKAAGKHTVQDDPEDNKSVTDLLLMFLMPQSILVKNLYPKGIIYSYGKIKIKYKISLLNIQ